VKVRTSRTILIVLAAVFLGGMAVMALSGDRSARRELPAQLAAWTTVGLVVFAGYWFKVRPRRELHQDEARSLSLRSAPGDAFGFLDRRFLLLGERATAKDVENTSWGTWRGRDVTVIDYWLARSSDPSRDDYEYFTCAATPVPADWPDLSIVPSRGPGWVTDAIEGRPIEFELERFNRAFDVRCADRRFALALVDGRMIEWLLGLPEGTGFEVAGATLLARIPRTTWDDVSASLETMNAFMGRIPPVVASLFPDRS
jgi:hypothetical protein